MKPKTAKATTKKAHVNVDTEISYSAFFVASTQPQTQTSTTTSTKKVPPQGRYDIILFKKQL